MAATGLDSALRIFLTADAKSYAGELFRESFNLDMPDPQDGILPVPTPPEAWRQYVAVYRWPDGREETVGFMNWIRYQDVYLAGGMCVRKNFYRRMPRDQFSELNRRGGLAQMMLETGFAELLDCVGWFGYCGDKKALVVDLRAGCVTTHQPYVVVKWHEDLPPERKRELIDAVAAIGPF